MEEQVGRSWPGGVGLMFFFPIFWMILTSFKTDADAVKPEFLLFFTPTLENYINMTENYDYWRFAANSVITSVFATGFTLAVGIPAAYAMAFNLKQAHQGCADVDAVHQDAARRCGALSDDIPDQEFPRHLRHPIFC